jgi:hypothetical protein
VEAAGTLSEYRVPCTELREESIRFSVLGTRYPQLTSELLDSFLDVSTPAVPRSSKPCIDDVVNGGAHGNTTQRK